MSDAFRTRRNIEWEGEREATRIASEILGRGRELFGPSTQDLLELYALGVKHGREIERASVAELAS